ncbi:MAG: CAP domain-containing protein [Anaerolineales bacterium]|nr:CAP domain-containing protein [Anaerolineales bacterium]
MVNAERTAHGCSPLNTNSALTSAATKHSSDMANNDFFSHTGSDGSQPWDRMTAAGYNWSNAAENIAAGYTTPAEVVDGWMGSSGHRKNMLNCDLKDTGVGYIYLANDPGNEQYQHYWTQVFGAPR